MRQIIESGDGILCNEYKMVLFPGDDLLAYCRPRGLPIGNLTSQFWSNCYLHPLDMLIKRELGCRAYLRYVDDFALFANNKSTPWSWKKRIISKLAELRLKAHQNSAQVCPVSNGIPWLGFVVYPAYRRVKRRKVVHSSKHLTNSFDQWQAGKISFAEFDARIKGWVNHVKYADSRGLRKHLFRRFVW